MNELTKQQINVIAKHLAYAIVEQESDIVGDPEKLQVFIEESLTDFTK